ncbi:MAG: hypothetical protein M9895_05145 [Aquamicrobium sp.]|uniref:hypothetical protein n=1 Tax=Aquamicrobium sp. TaxID=1872579 RepID=UPI00349EAB93|nr:hypothetical protein [Aquamicrobium sp.]
MGHDDDHAEDHAHKARPVSGEIMSGTQPREPKPQAGGDVSDAQYETVSPAADAPHARSAQAGAASNAAGPAGMDFLKNKTPGASQGTRRGGVLFWAAGLLAVALAFWISGGHALIGSGGPAEIAPAKTPLHIADVKSRVETREGRGVLFVDGRAENRGATPLPLPPIEIAVTANDGGVMRYRLSGRDTELKPGDRYSFSSRLEAPTAGVRTVSVAFQEDER